MLEVSGLAKRFGSKDALTDISFSVGEGEMFGFVGANGAGKSTTMRIIMGVLERTAGVISWQGRPLTRETARRFGYMPEERGLYQKMKVLDQIAYFGEVYGLHRTSARRSAVELSEQLGLDDYVNQEVQSLSLGNQQRVQLAVALVHSPEFLVLDEPFSGLDVAGVDALADILLTKQREGIPMIFSSHQLDLVERLITSIGIIDRGRILATGEVAEVRSERTRPHLRVALSNAVPGWESRLGAPVVTTEPDGSVIVDASAHDHTAILDVARTLGTVEEFRWSTPTLNEIFRETVS